MTFELILKCENLVLTDIILIEGRNSLIGGRCVMFSELKFENFLVFEC